MTWISVAYNVVIFVVFDEGDRSISLIEINEITELTILGEIVPGYCPAPLLTLCYYFFMLYTFCSSLSKCTLRYSNLQSFVRFIVGCFYRNIKTGVSFYTEKGTRIAQ